MKKITYIFGAGASANCLPIITEISDRIINFIDFLCHPDFILGEESFDTWKNQSKREVQSLIFSDARWLHSESLKHASIDTFAKKLFLLKDWDNLSRLKRILSVFFIVEQFRHLPDPRYDTFYASILKTEINKFPENMSIISWNYDYQFEIAYSEYSKDNRVLGNVPFPVISKFSNLEATVNSFALFKLNGTASFVRDGMEYTYFNYFKNKCDSEVVEEVIRNFAAGTNRINRLNSALSFAWETDVENEITILQRAIEATKNSEVLVVIGYSFPFFNRDIDRQFINSMTNLEKVYIQAPDAIDLAERFEAVRDRINPPKIIPRKDVSQFLLPNEL